MFAAYNLCQFQLGSHSHPTNGTIKCYSFRTNDDGQLLLDALASYNLTTHLVLDRAETGLWRHLDGHIRRHLATNAITFPPHPQHPGSRSFFHATWTLLEMKAVNTHHQRKLSLSRLNMERDYDFKALATISSRHRHPTTDDFRLLFIGECLAPIVTLRPLILYLTPPSPPPWQRIRSLR